MHTIVQRMVGACQHVTAHQWVALLLARLAIGFFQIPPDLVVKSQPADIIDIIL